MSQAAMVEGRRGGRSARKAMRAAPIPDAERAVKPGMESGRYAVLSEADKLRIHEAALDVLATIGFADPIPSCVEAVTAAGGTLSPDGRLLMPRALVEDTLAKAARNFTLHAQDPRHDLEPWGKRAYFGTGGAAVHIVDPITGVYRESYLKDLSDLGRLVDQSEHIYFFQRMVVPRDLPDPFEMDINT